nr:MAG TPA: hypothetical protein [Caudoviricetes sp.]
MRQEKTRCKPLILMKLFFFQLLTFHFLPSISGVLYSGDIIEIRKRISVLCHNCIVLPELHITHLLHHIFHCSQDRDFRSNTLCAVSGAVFSNRINDRTNLFKAIYTVDWKSEFFKLYLPLHLQRAHHLARSFQLTKTDVTSRKKHKTIRHTVHRLGRKL